MTYWLVVPFLGIISLIQSALVPLVTIAGFHVDLPLLIVVAWGLLSAPGEAAGWGFVAGLFLDLLSGLPFGTQTIALTSIGLVMGLVQTTIFRSNVVLPPAAMILATLGYDLVILAILSTLNWRIEWSDYVLHIAFPTAILNTFALPIAYFPLQRLHRVLNPRVEW